MGRVLPVVSQTLCVRSSPNLVYISSQASSAVRAFSILARREVRLKFADPFSHAARLTLKKSALPHRHTQTNDSRISAATSSGSWLCG